ncbi:HPP family protein [Vibrio breoganii]|uniref:HPP family protein n=1 Tax=Vibrio breoganii TaxID=553239 RepID=A0AAP8SW77_9VIBR|nr:HPP family protein [Vibrio breoganii]PMG34543.1 HPP family protein [Vibrio breoganii]PMG82062.1 HPP family protein [Vibrio breoganii]PMK15888.1 HPP family protein [Vibrio breoganii]PML82633.1 HPP family protein [Vibrio breoganii]
MIRKHNGAHTLSQASKTKFHYVVTHPAESRLSAALIAAVGSAACIALLAFIDDILKGDFALIAPFGASMVLVFGLPKSPLAQPKNVVFGHLVTALIGITAVNLLPVTFWSIGLTVGIGVFSMIMLKVTHPPAGGNPILIMLGGHTSYLFALYPVLTGSVLIVLFALIYHRFISRLEYAGYNPVKGEISNE